MKKVIIGPLFLLLLSSQAELPLVGYYYGGGYASQFSEYVDFVGVVAGQEQDIIDAVSKDLKVVIYMDPVNSSLDNYLPTIEKYRSNILGFYIFDEPILRGICQEYQISTAKKIKEYYPEIPIWINYAFLSLKYIIKYSLVFPACDIISITPDYDKTMVDKMKSYYRGIKMVMYSHQKFVIVGDGFHYCEYEMPGGGSWIAPPNAICKPVSVLTQQIKIKLFNDCYDWAASDPDIIGIHIFIYPTIESTGGRGIVDMPILEKGIKNKVKEAKENVK